MADLETRMKDIFECLCNWLETESEIELVTLKMLHEKMLPSSDGKVVYSTKWLQNILKEPAAKLIREEIKVYPSPQRYSLRIVQLTVTGVLNYFEHFWLQLYQMLLNNLQSIIQATIPRTSIPPILFGIGIEADHMFGSRPWLIDELFRLGFSIS